MWDTTVAQRSVVSMVLATADCASVSRKPWRLEEALEVLASRDSAEAEIAQWWLVRGVGGSRASGLESDLARFAEEGVLRFDPAEDRYFVCTEWRLRRRQNLLERLRPSAREAVAAAAAVLDRLERERVVSTTSAAG